MEYEENVKHLLHDVNNQLFILNTIVGLNKDRLKENHYLKLSTCSKIISQKINSIDMLSSDNYQNYVSVLNFTDAPHEISSIISSISAIYPTIVTEFEVVKVNHQIYYNKILMEQLIMNILDNSRKSGAKFISVKLKCRADALVLEFTDDGAPYKSDNNSLFHGMGKKIIQKISKQKNYLVDFKMISSGYVVSVTMNAVKQASSA